MRLALLADLHANREATTACLARLRRLGFDRLAFLGDLVGYGADPGWVIDTVQRLVDDGAFVVQGNHDEATVQGPGEQMHEQARAAIEWTRRQLDPAQLAFLAALPLTVLDGDRLYVHANARAPAEWGYISSPAAAARSLAATPALITFCGHVHEPALYHSRPDGGAGHFQPRAGYPTPLAGSRRWLALPGSVGQPRDGNPAACCAMLDTDQATLTFLRVPYDHEAAAARIRAAGLPDSFAARLLEGY
jgi:diadenosine tetraphosphatase ApaH/serine/threonine PP2A family protein phosphatase